MLAEFTVKYASFIWSVATTVVLIFLGFLSRTYAKRDDVVKVAGDLKLLSEHVKTLPTVQQVTNLRLEMSELNGDLKELKPQLEAVRRMSDLLLDERLSQGKN